MSITVSQATYDQLSGQLTNLQQSIDANTQALDSMKVQAKDLQTILTDCVVAPAPAP